LAGTINVQFGLGVAGGGGLLAFCICALRRSVPAAVPAALPCAWEASEAANVRQSDTAAEAAAVPMRDVTAMIWKSFLLETR
jgi:hypothetical protein